MLSGTFDQFKAEALAEGFDEVPERSWPADAVLDSHTHPFAQKARSKKKGIATVNWKIWPIFKSPPDGYLQTFR